MQNNVGKCIETLRNVQQKSPLVHSITNSVVTNITANILLAAGASPLMAHEPEELEEIVAISQALVINIGTLDKKQIESMELAMEYAKKMNIPTVLDPVGAGASKLRTETALNLIEKGKPAIIRGNSSEILALANAGIGQSRGVDAKDSVEASQEIAKNLAKKYDTVVSVSGEFDFITDGIHSAIVHANINENEVKLPLPVISKITGMGCSCTALNGACLAVQNSKEDYFIAAITAMAMMKSAQVKACEKADGPGSLEMYILDNLYNLKAEEISCYIQFKE